MTGCGSTSRPRRRDEDAARHIPGGPSVVELPVLDLLEMLERATAGLTDAVLDHPTARYPGAELVGVWDALDMLRNDPAAGPAEAVAAIAGMSRVAALLLLGDERSDGDECGPAPAVPRRGSGSANDHRRARPPRGALHASRRS